MSEAKPAAVAAIRPIVPDDEHELLALWKEVWTRTYQPSLGSEALQSMLVALDRQRLASMLPGTGERGYCAVSNGTVIGTIIIAERGEVAYI